MPPKPWKTLSSRPIYKNPWSSVREDIAEMPNGKPLFMEWLKLVRLLACCRLWMNSNVILIRQYRYVFDENNRWEMPTGGVKDGEVPT